MSYLIDMRKFLGKGEEEKMKIKKIITLILSSLLISPITYANQKELGQTHQELQKIKTKVEKIFDKHKVEIAITLESNRLIARFHTDKFMLHTIHKTGYISPKVYEQEGPNYDGILLDVSLRDGKYVGQAVIPQELNQIYWKTYINAYPINKEKQYLWLALSYGSRTNKELIKEIKECFGPIIQPLQENK